MLSKQIAGAAITYPTISAEPHQPKRFNFPKREFGKKSIVKRSFQADCMVSEMAMAPLSRGRRYRFLPYLCEGLQRIEDEC